MNLIETIVIAAVEGLTEFLPISSTAHMRITETFLGLDHQDDFVKIFTIAIQLGAILSVVVMYHKKFLQFSKLHFYSKLVVATIPALILGFFLGDTIESLLEKPVFIAGVMVLGGIVFLFVDGLFKKPKINEEEELPLPTAFKIGLFQCMAIVLPGLSRSAATILGGMQLRLNRKLAAEFSFFLAVPTMFAATFYTLFLKKWDQSKTGIDIILENQANMQSFLIGNLVAFSVALLAIRFFIAFLNRYGFKVWGWYRIIIGVCLFLLLGFGIIQ
ncbi:MAG: undecaprenyl-diphosphate phosphatase [Ferruginibacter sp.]